MKVAEDDSYPEVELRIMSVNTAGSIQTQKSVKTHVRMMKYTPHGHRLVEKNTGWNLIMIIVPIAERGFKSSYGMEA